MITRREFPHSVFQGVPTTCLGDVCNAFPECFPETSFRGVRNIFLGEDPKGLRSTGNKNPGRVSRRSTSDFRCVGDRFSGFYVAGLRDVAISDVWEEG